MHYDSPYLPIPHKATALYGITIPRTGGGTVFSNMYETYSSLSNGYKQLRDGLRGVCSAKHVHGKETESLKLSDVVKIRNAPLTEKEVAHPITQTIPCINKKLSPLVELISITLKT